MSEKRPTDPPANEAGEETTKPGEAEVETTSPDEEANAPKTRGKGGRGAAELAELERSLDERKATPSTVEADSAVSRVDQLQAQLERVQAESDTNRDKWLRAMAELDNFRKRSRQQFESSMNLARGEVLRQLLDVLDNFERARDAWEQSEDTPDETFLTGIRLIQDQLLRVLRENGVEQIESIGTPFDPNLHEAVSQIETDEVESHHVARVIKEGYRFQNMVLRPAVVVVAQ